MTEDLEQGQKIDYTTAKVRLTLDLFCRIQLSMCVRQFELLSDDSTEKGGLTDSMKP
jgi:hypothetical protein